ncbi:MAG: adenosylcobinamide-GDP ribazoletransferase [Gemmatimonadetes bacterium]|nr:adenosylcobinamide-GDP ribazoletransferase [Gemmatimonadota bacterium]
MLTTLRVPMRGEVGGSELAAATALYPLVGLGVGLVPAAALCLPLPALPRAVLALAAWTLATGALHLDGWADSCDAAFAPALADPAATRERRLAILKDPRVGVFGAAGVALLLLAKWAALVYAPTGAPLLAAPVARWVMVHTLHAHPAARPDGLGAALAGRARVWEATGVLVLLLAPLVVTFGDPFRAAGSVVAAALAGWLAAGFLARRFGGVTGDVCGAAGEAAELAALWVFLPWGSA